jgi:DNA-binding LacI/PurR family transcriptional regulator
LLTSFSETCYYRFIMKSESIPQQIAGALRQEIGVRFMPAEKLTGMHELKDRFSVSINTIGAALDILAGEGLVEKKRGSGVYVTERGACKRIGILSEMDLFDSRISPYWRSTAAAVKSRLEAAGHAPQLYIGEAEPGPGASDEPTCPRFWEDAAAGKLDAAVILDVPSTAGWHKRMKECPVPAVGAMTGFEASPDFAGIVDAAVSRLAANGCRTLGLLAWHAGELFRKAAATHGVESCDAWIRTEMDPALRGTGWEEFRDIWLAPEKPDGLVILDDMLFADAQLAMMEMGVRVPRELQLAVLTIRNASPPIRLPAQTFEIDPSEMAAGLVAMVMQRVGGETPKPAAPISWRERAVEVANGQAAKTIGDVPANASEIAH